MCVCVLVRTLSEAKFKHPTEPRLNIKRDVGGREDWLVHITGKFKVMPARMTGNPSTKKVLQILLLSPLLKALLFLCIGSVLCQNFSR